MRGAAAPLHFQDSGSRETQVQFKVKDQEYFLAFVEDEKRWYVFAPSPTEMQRIPVYVDAVNYAVSAAFGKSAGNQN